MLSENICITLMLLFVCLNNVWSSLVQPYQGIVKWLTCILVECNNCLPLVCDAESFHFGGVQIISLANNCETFNNVCIDFKRIMLTPSCMKRDLSVLSLLNVNHFEIMCD